jgi:dTDP-glucose 4,6-dehydratase
MLSKPLPHDDLESIVSEAGESFEALRGARVFITGGTGFFGHWLVESLLHANRVKQLGVRATILTRNVSSFRARSPWITADASVSLLEGDARAFQFPAEPHSHILHAATDSGGQQSSLSEAQLHDSIVEGTRHVLDFAETSEAVRMLYVSSGAVYGRSIPLCVPEEFPLQSLPRACYASAKQLAEQMCLSRGGETEAVIARCFAFVGPRLPLDQHFAIGNFIGAALAGETLMIQGDGTSWRSWLYMRDLAIWLWTLLVRGKAGRPYNVGSDAGHTIADAATLTAATLAPGSEVKVLGRPVPEAPPSVYVPCIQRAQTELGLRVSVPLAEALRRTAAWYRQ